MSTDSRAFSRSNTQPSSSDPYVRWTSGPSQEISWPDKVLAESAELPANRVGSISVNSTNAVEAIDLPERQTIEVQVQPTPSNERIRLISRGIIWNRLGLFLVLAGMVAFAVWAKDHLDRSVTKMDEQLQRQSIAPIAPVPKHEVVSQPENQPEAILVEFKQVGPAEPTIDHETAIAVPAEPISTRHRVVAHSPTSTTVEYAPAPVQSNVADSGVIALIKNYFSIKD